MFELYVINISGHAAPKILKDFAKQTAQIGGSWLASQIHYMEGQVAALIKVQIPKSNKKALEQILDSHLDLNYILTPCTNHPQNQDKVYFLVLRCTDRVGLIRDINQTLNLRHVQLISFSSHRVFIANTQKIDHQDFIASIELKLPASCQIEDIANELKLLDEDVRIELSQ